MFPLRSSKPIFHEKDPLSLRRYFEDVEELCKRYSEITLDEINREEFASAEKIKWALYYTPDARTEDLWRGYNTTGTSWTVFKNNIMELYPGSNGAVYLSDLRNFVARSAQGQFKTPEDVAIYHREFCTLANRLVGDSDGEMTDGFVDGFYSQGFPPGFERDFRSRLMMASVVHGRKPSGYSRNVMYNVALEMLYQQQGQM
jgi:hypothetical protein